jgi:hypothetical protein
VTVLGFQQYSDENYVLTSTDISGSATYSLTFWLRCFVLSHQPDFTYAGNDEADTGSLIVNPDQLYIGLFFSLPLAFLPG